MDTRIYSDNYIDHSNTIDGDNRDYDYVDVISNILFDNIKELADMDRKGQFRPCIMENIEKVLICGTIYLGFDIFECQECKNEMISKRFCHSRFCNTCGIKYAKQLAAKATTFCLDVPHRHIVFTIPQELREYFIKDRRRLDSLFIAARNTICAIFNEKLYRKLKKKNLKSTHYLFKDFDDKNNYGMIASLHTFGRDLKWNPHIHALVSEAYYNPKNGIKTKKHLDYKKLRKTFQYELLKLLSENDKSFYKFKTKLYKNHENGFYVYAKDKNEHIKLNKDNKNYSKDIKGCIDYCLRYAGRPVMAKSRIINYDKVNHKVTWFYNDHKDDKRYEVIDDSMDFIKKLIIHINDKHFRTIRYYGFYSNKERKFLDEIHNELGDIKKKNYSKAKRQAILKRKLNALKYRTHMIDSFNKDPLKCECGFYYSYVGTYNPLEGIKNDKKYRRDCINDMYRMRYGRRGLILDT